MYCTGWAARPWPGIQYESESRCNWENWSNLSGPGYVGESERKSAIRRPGRSWAQLC